ncbi:MAG: hypothetical protein AAGC85_06700 [Bacteroidota bacterium]
MRTNVYQSFLAIICLSLVFLPTFGQDNITLSFTDIKSDIPVSIETQLYDSWEVSGNMTLLRTSWVGEASQPILQYKNMSASLSEPMWDKFDKIEEPEVSLIQFNVAVKKNKAFIEWDIIEKDQPTRYVVQRKNGNKEWKNLGHVKVKADQKGVNTYTYIDNSPLLGSNRYRLMVEKKNKDNAYGPELILENFSGGYHTTFLYPMASVFGTTFRFMMNQAEEIQLYLLDEDGNLIGNIHSPKANEGQHVVEIDMDAIEPGSYICEIVVGEHRFRRNFTK